jgi:hypothetical protein
VKWRDDRDRGKVLHGVNQGAEAGGVDAVVVGNQNIWHKGFAAAKRRLKT